MQKTESRCKDPLGHEWDERLLNSIEFILANWHLHVRSDEELMHLQDEKTAMRKSIKMYKAPLLYQYIIFIGVK